MSEIVELVGEAAARGTAIALGVNELSPKRVLEVLAELGSSYRAQITGRAGSVTVELGNGLVVGAEATIGARKLSGKAAYACIRLIGTGDMHIERLRFPSMANILEPVAELVDLAAPRGPEPEGEDTVEVALPQARPRHVATIEPPTMEIDLLLEEEATIDEAAPPKPLPTPILTPETRQHTLPQPRRRRRALAAMAAAVLLGAIGVMWGISATEADAEIEPLAPLAISTPASTTHLATTTVDMDLSGDVDLQGAEPGTPAQARELARRARAQLQSGDAAGALQAARRAAEIRGGRPFYQVLLGDALRANGERAAANRAYRRAVRLRPGYRPAMRRLHRRRASNNPRRGASRT